MGQIIEFPDDKRSRERIQELKKTLEDLVFERDNLKFVICENTKTAYMLTFGSLEYRLYKAYCKYLRLKRKRDMIQAKKNRQEKIKMEVIDKKLDEEFADYKKKLDEKVDEINPMPLSVQKLNCCLRKMLGSLKNFTKILSRGYTQTSIL